MRGSSLTLGKEDMADDKHKIRNTVIASLTTAALTALVQYLVPGGWATVFRKVRSVIGGIFEWLGSSQSVPTWLLCLLVLLSVILVTTVWLKIRAANRGPSRDDYTEDEFDGLVWRWHYGFSGSIENPWCFCPSCDSILVYREDSGDVYVGRKPTVHFTCERCGVHRGTLDGDRAYIVARIQRLIDRKLRVGEWHAVVAKKQKPA
jgi:hypothetical protein